MKIYTNFKEIDRDLAIVKLERDIAWEKAKLDFNEAKSDLSPMNLLGGFGGIIKKLLITLLIKRIIK